MKALTRVCFAMLIVTGPGVPSDLFSQNLTINEAEMKRGKSYSFQWSGGSPENRVHLEIAEGKSLVHRWEGLNNDGETVIVVPNRLKPGIYQFRISDAVSGAELAAREVMVKRRVPLAVTLAAIAIVPAALVISSRLKTEPNRIADMSSPPSPDLP